MRASDESLKNFGRNIQRLIQKEDLSRNESYEMFRQLLLNEQPDLQQGAFLAALVSKGETPGEIAGAWQAITEFDTVRASNGLGAPLVENSGTGMDQLKTFNVSSAASIVAASGGVRIARHGARALTSSCGAVDLLEMLGIDVECDVAMVLKSIREAGIGIFNGMSPKVHPHSLFRILSDIRFGSTLNIAASLAGPCRPTHGLRGVYSRELVPKVAEVMKAIGYARAMVVHGFDAKKEKGMDELSNIGETLIHEFCPDGSEQSFFVAPEDLGLKRSDFSSVAATGDMKQEALRFMRVLSGTGSSECIDLTCLNAGAIFYLVDITKDIKAGIELSRELIHSGKALEKLGLWVSLQRDAEGLGMKRFQDLSKEAGIKSLI